MEPYVEQTPLTDHHRGALQPTTIVTPQLIHNERLKRIIDELVAGKSKRAIVLNFSEEWNLSQKTITSMINEAVIYLHSIHSGNTIEELRSEQVSKLEELYMNASTTEKLKIIDLVSSTLGLYDTNLNVKTSDEIKINLGV